MKLLRNLKQAVKGEMMNTFGMLLFIFGSLAFWVILIIFIVRKVRKTNTKKSGLISLICLGAAFAGIIIGVATTDTTNKTVQRTSEPPLPVLEENAEDLNKEVPGAQEKETNVDDIEALRKMLEEKYDITEPIRFPDGDTTGKWRVEMVANGTAPSKYAVDYARAYMQEGDIHFIVNLSLNTTTKLNVLLGKLSVITTEYVEKEYLDARVIGSGMLYTEQYFDMDTGEEIKAEADLEAGTVDEKNLITAVKYAIEGQVGEGEKITGVEFDGSNLTVKIDLSNADTSILSTEMIAESRISSITDAILDLNNSYYNTWETVTVDFGSVGKAVLDKSMVKDQGLGRFFDFPADILK